MICKYDRLSALPFPSSHSISEEMRTFKWAILIANIMYSEL